jgi:purine-binding chemotaxis protein CheW
MSDIRHFVVFKLDDQRYALPLTTVERIVRMVEVTPVPEVDASLLGVINVQGRIIPVVNTRHRFGLPSKPPCLSDQLIIARAGSRSLALVADAVTGVLESSEGEIIPAHDILPGMDHVHGVLKQGDGMILLHDLDTFDGDRTLRIAASRA